MKIIAAAIILLIHGLRLYAQSADTTEVQAVAFSGNNAFGSEQLQHYINSKATSTSLPNKILRTYYNETAKNQFFPQSITEQLAIALKRYATEYHFLNTETVAADSAAIAELYNINGFHDATITTTFAFNTNTKRQTLTFNINEGRPYKLAAKINYNGLEHLPQDVKTRLDTIAKLQPGHKFNEADIEAEIKAVTALLLRTGYMNAKWTHTHVITDSAAAKDSVIAYFEHGNRIKIGQITFNDSTGGQKIFASSTKTKLLRLTEGTYYSKPRIERATDNLLSTGVFQSVRIDTVAKDYGQNDSLRDFVVTSVYRKLKDWSAGLSFFEATIDGRLGLSAEADILHRNAFGSAQATSLFGSAAIKDINHFLTVFDFPQLEFKIGVRYQQPMLWTIESYRVALNASLEYSYEIMAALFRLSKVYFPVSLPVSLPWRQYFSKLNIEFEIARETPLNYAEVASHALDSARTPQDSIAANQALLLYGKIHNYLAQPKTHIFTSNLLTLSLVGDSRDNLFNPTEGSMTLLTVDGFNPLFFPELIQGGAKYFRASATYLRFWPLSPVSTVGIKGKAGLTYVFDEGTSFVPQARQFFAGGPNSVRAWASRQLRYSGGLATTTGELGDFARDYIGSKSLLEGSIEYRRRLSDIPGVASAIASVVSALSVGVFIDFGNTFGWYADTQPSDLRLADYVKGLAVGAGAGLRYETPIGPLRLDFATPLYDPAGLRPPFYDLTLAFGIGHAF